MCVGQRTDAPGGAALVSGAQWSGDQHTYPTVKQVQSCAQQLSLYHCFWKLMKPPRQQIAKHEDMLAQQDEPLAVNKILGYPYNESLYESIQGFRNDSLCDSIRNPFGISYMSVVLGSRRMQLTSGPVYTYRCWSRFRCHAFEHSKQQPAHIN